METPVSKSIYNKRFVLAFISLEEQGVITSRIEVAQLLSIDPSRLTEIVKGRRNVSVGELAIFASKYHLNPFYILYETKPIFIDPGTVGEFIQYSMPKVLASHHTHPSVHPSAKYSIPHDSPMLLNEPEEKPYNVPLVTISKKKKGKTVQQHISIEELGRLLGIDSITKQLREIAGDIKKLRHK